MVTIRTKYAIAYLCRHGSYNKPLGHVPIKLAESNCSLHILVTSKLHTQIVVNSINHCLKLQAREEKGNK